MAGFVTRAVLLVAFVAIVSLAAFPIFGRGADNGAAGDDENDVKVSSVAAAGTVVLVNQTFKCSDYPQPLDLDLVKVTITSGQGVRRDGMHTSGTGRECTGRIGRLEIDTWDADGVKVHNQARDLVIEGGYIRCHDNQGEVHQDGIQAMGGTRVTFKNLLVDCAPPEGVNSAMFINAGGGGNGRPADIVCDGCILKKAPTRNRVLRISDSLRSGARNSTIVWCGDGPNCGEGSAVYIIDAATDPVNENNKVVRHGESTQPPGPPPGPPPPGEPETVFKLSGFSLSSVTPAPGKRLSAILSVAGTGRPTGADASVVTCLGSVAGKAVTVAGKSYTGSKGRCAFTVPKAGGKLLSGVIGITNKGTTVNRSFTVRIAAPNGATGSTGRVGASMKTTPSGASVRQFALSSQQPASGARLFTTITLAGLDSTKGTVTCSGVAGGKSLRVLSSKLKGSAATCGWRVPAGVRGKPLRFSVTVATERTRFTHSFFLNVRR